MYQIPFRAQFVSICVSKTVKALHFLFSRPPVTVPGQMPLFFQVKEIAVAPDETRHIGEQGGSEKEKAVACDPVDRLEVRN